MCEVCEALDAAKHESDDLRAKLERERDARHRAEDEQERLRRELVRREARALSQREANEILGGRT